LVDAAINRIEKLDGELNAVIHPLFDQARAAAGGTLPDGPFRGVPALVKDLDGGVKDAPLHLGNKLLKELDRHATHDSYLVAKLREAGFVIVGKTNTPELGLMPTTEPLAYGPTHNPWNPAHSPGGSSGGSAAAVASGMVPVAHAGDGGGSIRIPASACGIVGLKPSRGRNSLGPDISEAWAGFVARHVVTRSVRDTAALLDALSGPMPGDYYTAPPPDRPFREEVGSDPGRLRIGLRRTPPSGLAEVDADCVAAVEDVAALLESLGHTVEESAPDVFDGDEFLSLFTTVFASNIVFDLDEIAAFAGRAVTSDDVEPVTWALAEGGRAISAATYIDALMKIHQLVRLVTPWWEVDGAAGNGGRRFDLLLTPTMAEPPAVLGDIGRADDPVAGFSRATPFAAFTAVFNVTGQPAMSLPMCWSDSGLPLGIQLTAAPYREDVLIRIASQLEQARPWADRRPPIHA
jgi:amidase